MHINTRRTTWMYKWKTSRYWTPSSSKSSKGPISSSSSKSWKKDWSYHYIQSFGRLKKQRTGVQRTFFHVARKRSVLFSVVLLHSRLPSELFPVSEIFTQGWGWDVHTRFLVDTLYHEYIMPWKDWQSVVRERITCTLQFLRVPSFHFLDFWVSDFQYLSFLTCRCFCPFTSVYIENTEYFDLIKLRMIRSFIR